MSDEEKREGILSYPNRPGLRNVTVEEVAKQSEQPGPRLDYPVRQAGYEKPVVRRLDGEIIAPGAMTDVVARQGFLANANLEGLRIDGHMVATDRNLVGASLRGASIRGAKLSGWNCQGADLSGAKIEDCDCSHWDLTGAKTQGLRFVRCAINGTKGAPKSAFVDCVGIPGALFEEKEE